MDKIVSRYTMPYRILVAGVSIFCIILSPIAAVEFYRNGQIIELFMYCVPIFIFGWFAVISSFRRMIIITDKSIEKRNIKDIRIGFDEVTLVRVYHNQMEICSEQHKIPITKDCEQYKKLMALVLRRVTQLPDVEIRGRQDVIDEILTQW